MTTPEQKRQAATALVDTMVEAIGLAGDWGAPAGPMYAALMPAGCTLEMFEDLMALCVASGRITKRGDLYFLA